MITSSSAFSKARSTFGDMPRIEADMLHCFLADGDIGPRHPLRENLHRLIAVISREVRGLS